MAASTTENAIDLLIEPVDYNWPLEFEVRGRRYTMVLGGPASFSDERAVFRVWNSAGRMTDVTVRPTDAVRMISYGDVLGNVFPV